jgi:thioredoxin reductase (NADPH)
VKIYDAAVLGAGPAGLTAALYLARSGASVALVEKGAPGGQMLNTAFIENYPGFPQGIAGWELTDLFSSHLDAYPVERLREEVEHLEIPSDLREPSRVLFRGEREGIAARTIILATGTGHRKLGVPGEERLLGKGVSYCAVCDGNFYRGQRVAVAGGGNSAMEEALYLSRLAGGVALVHRRESFRGNRHYLEKILALPDKIELLTSHVIEEIRGGDRLESLLLRHVDSGAVRVLPVDGLFIYVGLEPHNAFLPPAVRLDPQGFIITNAEMGTGVGGIFAAGDIRSKNCRQISSAVGDGAAAAIAAFSYLELLNA